MRDDAEELDADRLRELFQELSDRLAERGQQAQLFVVGGAAMALEYDGGRVTRDVDAVFAPGPEVRQLAEELSAAHGLEPDWINDAVKGFMPGQDDSPRTVFESESLLVQVPSPQYLLAMKLHAARDERDLNDAATLYNKIGYTTAAEGRELLTRTYPPAQLLPRHRYVVEEVAQRAAAQRDKTPSGVEPGARSADLRSASYPQPATEVTRHGPDSPQARARTSGPYGRGYGSSGRGEGR